MAKKNKKKVKIKAAPSQAKIRELRALFHAVGLRLTRQRMTIYRELESRHDHPDVDHLYRAVKPIVPKISLFTVYRTMNTLEAAGLIWRVTTWRSHARYGTGADSHAHFLCETCGRIDNVEVGNLGALRRTVEKTQGPINRVDMIFRGIGSCCTSRERRPPSARPLA